MLPSFIGMVGVMCCCALIADFIPSQRWRAIAVVVVVVVAYGIWLLLIDPKYLVLVVYLAWLFATGLFQLWLIRKLRPIFKRLSERTSAYLQRIIERQTAPLLPPFAPYRPISPPLTQEDIDRGRNETS